MSLFGYYNLGLRALDAAQIGLSITGDNISNVNTPGFARRRVELTNATPLQSGRFTVGGGVAIDNIRRTADRFLQANLEREQGVAANSRETLRGLQSIESVFGDLDGNTLNNLYASFAERFSELAGSAEDNTAREVAITSAQILTDRLNGLYSRLDDQRRIENESVLGATEEINRLAEQVATLNREIFVSEVDGTQSSPLRDEQQRLIERLAELTGGVTATGDNGRQLFVLPGGPTLVTGDGYVPVKTTTDAQGNYQLSIGSVDVTSKLRTGELGALLELRDDQLADSRTRLDTLATDLITRVNAVTTGGFDVQGNPGVPLFEPDPPPATGAAALITINPAVAADPRLLAISSDGAPGNGDLAEQIAQLRETASAALSDRSPEQYINDLVSDIGTDAVRTDVELGVSEGIVATLQARRDSVSGVSLDEEAVNLIRYQRAYEAAARFINVLNQVTEVTLSIGR